jgi:hypothetical protein
MYKLASLMTSELGRAYDTLKTKPHSRIRLGTQPKHQGGHQNVELRKVNAVAGKCT